MMIAHTSLLDYVSAGYPGIIPEKHRSSIICADNEPRSASHLRLNMTAVVG